MSNLFSKFNKLLEILEQEEIKMTDNVKETFTKSEETWKAYLRGAEAILSTAKKIITRCPTFSPLEVITTCEQIILMSEKGFEEKIDEQN